VVLVGLCAGPICPESWTLPRLGNTARVLDLVSRGIISEGGRGDRAEKSTNREKMILQMGKSRFLGWELQFQGGDDISGGE